MKDNWRKSRPAILFFWSGRSCEECCDAREGFSVRSSLVSKLTEFLKGINDRLMTFRLPIRGKRFTTFISAYAPTMTNQEEIKDEFYEDLENAIEIVPMEDKLILLGDLFNDRVSTDHQTWEGIIGRNGVGKCNSNGLLLLKACASHDLLITNTVYRQPIITKHPGCTHVANTGTWSTILLSEEETDMTSEWRKQGAVQTAGLTVGTSFQN